MEKMDREDSKSMVIFVVLLRLFCIFWLLEIALIQIVQVYMTMSVYESSLGEGFSLLPILASLIFIVILCLGFIYARQLALVLFSGLNVKETGEKIPERVLYAAVFVGVGAYFFMSNIGTCLQHLYNWLVYRMEAKEAENTYGEGSIEETMLSIYGEGNQGVVLNHPRFIEAALGSFLGLVLILSAKVWAGKLARKPFPSAQKLDSSAE